jgi:hypothetical protein
VQRSGANFDQNRPSDAEENEDDNEDDDALLAWCESLDYEQYVEDWGTLATTIPSLSSK